MTDSGFNREQKRVKHTATSFWQTTAESFPDPCCRHEIAMQPADVLHRNAGRLEEQLSVKKQLQHQPANCLFIFLFVREVIKQDTMWSV